MRTQNRRTRQRRLSAAAPAMVALLVALWGSAAAAGRTFYVDFDAGADARDGLSPRAAWKHSPGDPAAEGNAKAAALAPGDTVLFKGGAVYRGSIKMVSSGKPGAPIIFDGNTAGAFGKGPAVFDGSERLTGWKRCESAGACGGNPHWKNVYHTWVPADENAFTLNLYEGERMIAMATDPDLSDPFYLDNYPDYRPIPKGGCTPTTITDPAYFTQSDAHHWDGAYVAILGQPMYVRFRKVTGYEPSAHRIVYEKMPAPHYTGAKAQHARYAMMNSLKAMNRPGEFIFSGETDDRGRHKVYVWPPTGGDIAEKTITISRLKIGFDINGQSHVTVRGFTIQKYISNKPHRGAGVSNDGRPTEGLVIRDNTIRWCNKDKHSSWKHAGINLGGAKNCLVDGNHIYENRRCGGIYILGGENCTVRGNRVRRDGYQGIWIMGAKGGRVVGNTVLDNLATHSNGISTYSGASDILVFGNTVINSNAPFTSNTATNITVAYNVFSGSRVADWGRCTNLRFFNNVVMTTGGDATALYLARRSQGVVLRNNIISGAILDDSVEHSHNLWTGQSRRTVTPGEGGAIETDMKRIFVDAAKGNYRLRPGSPAIDAGADVGLDKDLSGTPVPQGKAPDIGAYEHREQK